MKHFTFIAIVLGLSFFSCNNDDAEVEGMPEEFKKNPTTVEWEKTTHDFWNDPSRYGG
ncbi:MAG: hypothetical protein R2799_15870 [Crocinitomicaceae bacterium]